MVAVVGESAVPAAATSVSDKSGSDSQPVSGDVPSNGSTVATFATPIGIIEPPPEVKIVIDRTAEFVRKTGSAGEEQLLAKNRNNKKFAFLNAQSPYHTYYKHRVKNGADTADAPDAQQQTKGDEHKRKEEAERAEKERLAEEERQVKQKEEEEAERRKPRTLQQRLQLRIEASRLDGPTASDTAGALIASSGASSHRFLAPHPSHYSSSDLDVVHLTALYASHLGGGFLSSLQQRERTNAAFDFLKPQHPLYSYYGTARQSFDCILKQHTGDVLADYRRCIQHPNQLTGRLMEAARDKRRLQAEEETRQREAQEDSEVMSTIDWQSFIVVETVEFTADEEEYLPPPKRTIEEMEALIAELAIEEEREREERERQESERREREKREQEAMQNEAAAAAEAAANMPAPPPSTAAGAVIEHVDEQLEVRTSAVLPSSGVGAAAAPLAAASKLVTCVVCGDTIAAEDLEEHLRIELLDPRWKEQKQALIDRQRETSLVAGKSISDNLRRFERKKREIGRERTREEEARQEREDALLLRGAARQDINPPAAQPSASTNPTADTHTDTTTAGADEPLSKRLRPTSPAPPTSTISHTAMPPHPPPPPPPATTAGTVSSTITASPHPSIPPSTSQAAVSAVATASRSVDTSSAAQSAPTPTAAPPKASAAQLVDESVWLSAHPLRLTVSVRVPTDPQSTFDLRGQDVSVSCRLTDTIEVLRAAVSAACNGLPANRQQFQLLTGTFLKEGHSLAYYNVYDGAVLTLKLKERGGKRK